MTFVLSKHASIRMQQRGFRESYGRFWVMADQAAAL